jgi:hypothetical protein
VQNLLVFAGAALAPPIGLLLNRPVTHRYHRFRQFLALLWHLLTLVLWTLLALMLGRPPSDGLAWSAPRFLLVLAAGITWTESFFLLGLPTRSLLLRGEPHGHFGSGPQGHFGGEARGVFGAEPAHLSESPSPEMEEGDGTSDLPPQAKALLARIQGLDQVPVDALMTPRERIISIDGIESAVTALEQMRLHGRSRLLVVGGGSLDRVLGVVHAKDLIALSAERAGRTAVQGHLRRCLRIASGQSMARLLDDFRQGRVHVAIVADPLGQTLGLITLRDLFQHIAGVAGTPVSDQAETAKLRGAL